MMTIGVIGAGAMGSGIAQVAAMAGHDVLLFDAREEAIVSGLARIRSSLDLIASKGRITDTDARAAIGRIFSLRDLGSLKEAGLVIEAIVEDQVVKEKLFQDLEPLLASDTLLATNTSSLPITAMARSCRHPGRFVGLHFFNPPVLMRLVEVIPALQTDSRVVDTVMGLVRGWGKTPVIARDTPGFIVNRIARPYYSEAMRIAEENLATPAEIDAAMRQLGGFRMGPFELMDFIGHDVNEAVTRSVWSATHFEPRYTPSSLQVNLVRAGWLGRKTGRGFYEYTGVLPEIPTVPEEKQRMIVERILVMLIHEAADALHFGIATREDIDTAMTLGVNYPKGLLQWADELGATWCVDHIDELYSLYRESRYRGSARLRQMAAAGQRFFP